MLFAGEGRGDMGTERGQSTEESKRRVHNAYINLVPVSYPVLLLLYVQKNAQRRTTQHRKTKGRARHRTALRCAADLYITGLT